MRRSRRLRQSVDQVLAEELREWERTTQSRDPVPAPPDRTPPTLRQRLARHVVLPLGAVAVGAVGGELTGDRSTGTAFGVAAGLLIEAALRQLDG